MATPAQRNITLYQGDSYSHEILIAEADGVTPIDVSAYTATASIAATTDSATAVNFTVDDTDANVGVLVLTLTAAETAALTRLDYVYDVQLFDDPTVWTVMYGDVKVIRDVTT